MTEQYSHLSTYLQELDFTNSLRILDAGISGQRWRTATPVFLEFTQVPITYLENNKNRALAAKQDLGERLTICEGLIDQFYAGTKYDFVYVDLLPRRMPELFSAILPAAAAHLNKGGIIAVNIPVRQMKSDSCGPDDFGFQQFVAAHADQANIVDVVQATLLAQPEISDCTVLQACHNCIEGFGYTTLAVRLIDSPITLRLGGQPYKIAGFRLDDAINLLSLLAGRVHFVGSTKFIDTLTHCQHSANGRGVHFIKHDIHTDLLNTYRLAKAEAELGVIGAYFIMHPHKLSRHYIDRRETIEVLLEIQAMGHEIGVHVDTIKLLMEPEGLIATLKPFISELRSAGVTINAGNTHGNTAYKEFGVPANFVFSESFETEADESLKKKRPPLAGSVSLLEIAAILGVEKWIDSSIYVRGNKAPNCKFMIGDNYWRLTVYKVHGDGTPEFTTHCEGALWESSTNLHEKVVAMVCDTSCMHLFHPQYYR